MNRFHLVEIIDGHEEIIETSEAEFIPSEGSTIVVIGSSNINFVRYVVLKIKHVLDKRFGFENSWVTEVLVEKIK